MAELGQAMEIDSRPVVPPHNFESLRPWDISKLRETVTASLTQLLGPIREAVREEVKIALNYEQRTQKSPGPDPAIETRKLHEQLQLSRAERDSLSDQVDQLKKEAALAQLAVIERDKRNKKLQQVIIENSQNNAPPMDDEIITLFNQLNHEIMRIVKKHFTRPMRMVISASEQPPWKEFKLLSAENRELWVRAYIADDLYEEFFRKKRMIFGFDDGRDVAMRDFESTLLESGKVSEADIIDWRIRTISCGQKGGLASPGRFIHEPANETIRGLRPVAPLIAGEQKDAEKAMVAIYNTALTIAILFRGNTVSYSWLQNKSPSSIQKAEIEIIGSTDPGRPAEQCKPWRIVFGGVVKSQNSEEDRVVLTKSELLVN